MKPIDLAGFDAKFRENSDPWRTFTDADEAAKRRAILRALGLGRRGRVWEPASGAGANSVALARRALRLDATDGAPAAVALTADALREQPRACAAQVVLPAPPPHARYDAVVVAEVLYYLAPSDMERFGRTIAQVLRPAGRLVLAHHRRDFYDFAQPAAGIHARLLRATRIGWSRGPGEETNRWTVRAYDRRS